MPSGLLLGRRYNGVKKSKGGNRRESAWWLRVKMTLWQNPPPPPADDLNYLFRIFRIKPILRCLW